MNKKKVTVVAHFQACLGKEQELLQVLTDLVAPTLKETGCLNYDLHQSLEDPTQFVFYENWVSKEDLDRHAASPHLQALPAKVAELCFSSPKVTLWEQIV